MIASTETDQNNQREGERERRNETKIKPIHVTKPLHRTST